MDFDGTSTNTTIHNEILEKLHLVYDFPTSTYITPTIAHGNLHF